MPRKLKFYHRKRERRSLPKSLKMSISLCLVKAPQLLVSIPLGQVSVPNTSILDQLYDRTFALLPQHWNVSFIDNEKVVCRKPYFTVSVLQDMLWKLQYGSYAVGNDSCLVLSEISNRITGAEFLMMLLQKIDDAKLCIGNPDETFIKLAHKGEFLDQSSEEYYYSHLNNFNYDLLYRNNCCC